MNVKIVNKREMASILGVSERTLSEWQKVGLPFVKGKARGASNFYQTPAVIAWMIAREKAQAPGQEGERDRLARLQGDMLEITLAEKRGELIPAKEIEPAYAGLIVAARQTLLMLPARLAPLLAGMSETDQIRDLLDEQVHDVLAKLAGTDCEPGADGDARAPARPVDAAAEDSAVAVGGGKP